MSYQIDSDNELIIIEFYGTLDAFDMIMLNQSQDYKTAIKNKTKMLMDFTSITGSSLTAKDAQGLAMLGKMDSERVKGLHLVIASDKASAPAIQHICSKILADSSWQVDIVESRAKAKNLLGC